MVPLFDGPFEHHSLDEPERDRDRAVTPDCDIKFPIIRTTICVNIPLGEIRAVFFVPACKHKNMHSPWHHFGTKNSKNYVFYDLPMCEKPHKYAVFRIQY